MSGRHRDAGRRAPRNATACTAALLAVSLLTGCSGLGPSTRSGGETPAAGGQPAVTSLPTTPAMDRARAIMDHLNGSPDAPPTEVLQGGTSLEHPDTLDAVAAATTGMHGLGPWTPVRGTADEGGLTADLLSRSVAGQYAMTHVSLDEQGKTAVLWFGPAVDPRLADGSPDQLADAVASLPADSSVTVARAGSTSGSAGGCHPAWTAGSRTGESMPLASVSKVFILGAVLLAVDDGQLDWDTGLILTEANRSLPAGHLASEEAGLTVDVSEAVTRMMRDSDNTAADLLHGALGPERLASAWTSMTGSTPEDPFRSTRDVFLLGWSPTAGVDGPVPGTSTAEGRPLDLHPLMVSRARWQDGLDWFATSEELCRAGSWLDARWKDIPDNVSSSFVPDASTWPPGTILAKSGGVPGVVSDLVLVREGGRTWILTSQFASEFATDVGDHAGMRSLAAAALSHAMMG